MSKVYLVNKHYDNNEPYEDNFQYNETLMAFDTKEKAENFIKRWLPNPSVELTIKELEVY